MKARSFVAFAIVWCAATALASSASADRPARIVENVAGGQVICGDTVLTAIEGTGVGRQHVHQLRSGLYRVIFRETLHGIRLTDGSQTYRAVGSVCGNTVTADPDNEGAIVSGFFHIKVNIIGPGGLLGSVDFSERLTPSGTFSETNRGSCQFADEEE